MNVPEAAPQSFIVRVWLEETAEEAGRATWRGHITHVPGGEQRYVQDLDEVPAFIMPYLEQMGIRSRPQRSARERLRRFRRRFASQILDRRKG
jgi:hypothetical protein